MNSSKKRYKVAIIGAGIAGLSCGQTLLNYGLNKEDIIILEARDRIGGRVLTKKGFGTTLDHGAAWIHGTRENPLAIALEGSGVVLQQVSPANPWMIPACVDVAMFSHGRRLDATKRRHMLTVFQSLMDTVAELAIQPQDAPQSLAEALVRAIATMPNDLDEDEREMLEANALLIEVWMGGSLKDMQALTFADDDEDDLTTNNSMTTSEDGELWGDFPGPHCLPVGGMGQLLDVVATRDIIERVETSRVVTQICTTTVAVDADDNNTSGVAIDCEDGSVFCADCVVVTLPLGVLQSNAVIFSPPLPQSHVEAISRLRMGAYKKVMLQYAEPFWPGDAPFLLMARSNDVQHARSFEEVALRKLKTLQDPTHDGVPDLGPFLFFDDYFNLKGIPVLEAVCVAEQGFLLTECSDEIVARAVTKYVYANFPDAPEPTHVHVTRWEEDPFSQGAYSFFPMGAKDTDVSTLAEPVNATIYFAGEAVDCDYQGSVNAAHRSAIRAAGSVWDDHFGVHDDNFR